MKRPIFSTWLKTTNLMGMNQLDNRTIAVAARCSRIERSR